MGKTRSCRRTPEENSVHEQAVRIRKMTDAKLVDYINTVGCQEYKSGYEEGLKAGKEDAVDLDYEISAFIEAVAYLPGIGGATVAKMYKLAEERGIHVR